MGYSRVWSFCCPDLKASPSSTKNFPGRPHKKQSLKCHLQKILHLLHFYSFLFSYCWNLSSFLFAFPCSCFLSSLYSVLFLFLFFTFFFNFKCSPRSESAEGHPEWLLLPPCAGSLAKACKATPAGAPCFAQAL